MNNISQIHKVRGDYETALSYLESSLKIRQEIGDRKGEGATLNNISQIHKDAKGDYETALSYLESSLKIRQEIGDARGVCVTLHNMAHIHLDRENGQAFLEHELEAYRIAKHIQSWPDVFDYALSLGAILCRSQMIKEGMPYLKEAFSIGQQMNYPQTSTVAQLIQQYQDG